MMGGAAAAGLPPADLGGGFQAVHLGHLDIHEDEIEAAGQGGGDGGAAVVDHGDGVSAAFEQPPGHQLVDFVILRQEDAPGGRRRGGGLAGLGWAGGIQDGRQGRQHQGLLHGLHEDGVGRRAFGRASAAGERRGQGHDAGGLKKRVLADEPGDFEATRHGGVQIEYGHGERLAPGGGVLERGDHGRGVAHRLRADAPAGERFDDVHAPRVQADGHKAADPAGQRDRRLGGDGAGEGELRREVEDTARSARSGRAICAGAFEPHPAAHQRHEAGADGQSQAGAAVLPGGGTVGLLERLEDSSSACPRARPPRCP